MPKLKSIHYFAWMNDLACVLQRTGTFPIGSQLAKHAASTNNGFHAILALITDTRPSFVDQPMTWWPILRNYHGASSTAHP
jgi:hypothetical protein